MTAITADKIEFLLSGGSSNSDPRLSIGGLPSGTHVGRGPNALFPDLSDPELSSGKLEHRCVYVVNSSEEATLWDASVFLASGVAGVSLGVARVTESQVVSVDGPVFFGSVAFSLDGNEFSADWGSSAEEFASNLEASLVSLGLAGVEVYNTYVGSSKKFTVAFGGPQDNRVQPLLSVSNNDLQGVGSPSVSVYRQTAGSPINSPAPLLATPATPPARVEFVESSPSSKIMVGTLGPGEYMSVWVRRNTVAGAAPRQGNEIVIGVSGAQEPQP